MPLHPTCADRSICDRVSSCQLRTTTRDTFLGPLRILSHHGLLRSGPLGCADGAFATDPPLRLYNGGDSVAGSVLLPGRLALAAPNPIRNEPKTSGRRKAVIALAIGAFLLLTILVGQASFNLKFISPDSNQELLFFAGLSGLIFFAFLALTLVLGRNLLKLYAERRQGVAGSKFRTRLVVVSLLLSFLPVTAMFWFSYGLMNRSIDKWFSQPVEEVRADTAAMSALLYDYAGQRASSEAQSIAQTEEFQQALTGKNFSASTEELREHLPALQGGFVLALKNGDAAASLNTPARWADMKDRFPVQLALRGTHPHFQWGATDYIVGAA